MEGQNEMRKRTLYRHVSSGQTEDRPAKVKQLATLALPSDPVVRVDSDHGSGRSLLATSAKVTPGGNLP
ncbi:hypothetical protein SeMB42_g02498 [Synchytrium endobioticum]|uniref:Uncharacterized protein n=1 Tax=Synchytrium endobioticum TaxID=286115 RepID=A0A507DDS0_9FUNG|nr:hypothetical protein SeMB42_g02498 [Synchytrium endobioticum]